jgi:hypothetical protein
MEGLNMLGLAGSLQSAGRARIIVPAIAAILAMVALSVWVPSPAHASGCENTFTNTKGGSWLEAANWSKKSVPTSSEEVCISESGTYEVELNGAELTVKALTIGGSSGTQTLSLGSTCGVNLVLTVTAGVGVGVNGALVLTNGDGCGNNATLIAAVNNAGTLTSEPAHGGVRSLQGNLTNTATLAINANTSYNGTKAALSNKGAINVAAEKALTVSGGSSVTNGTGGKIAGGTSGAVVLSTGSSFSEGAGTTSGTLPVILDNSALSYEASGGESTIAVRGEGSTLSGTSSAKQSLLLQSTCGENVRVTAASGFTNAGSIALTKADGCGTNDTLLASAGTLSNSGTITTEQGTGQRNLQGNLTNTGTLTINVSTAYNGSKGQLINQGAINIANEVQLSVSGEGSVTNGSGGKIATAGSGNMFLNTGSSFSEGAGTTSGTLPVILDNSALSYAASGGESTIAVRGEGSTLTGTSSPKQSLLIQSTCGENAKLTAASGFTNGGSVGLGKGDGCGNNATLLASAGTLSNSGTITTEQGPGQRNLQGNLTNTGTLAINVSAGYNGVKGVLLNQGAINIAEGLQLSVTGGNAVTNGTGGSISAGATGDLFMNSGTSFKEGAGTTSGTTPVFLDNSALTYEGSGESTIQVRGEGSTLSGSLAANQSLVIQSTCGEHATLTAAASYVNAGSITLTNGDACGDNAALLNEGTMTNSGTVTTEPLHGGARYLLGNITNTGTLAINANTSRPENAVAATLANQGTVKIATGVAFSLSGKSTVTNELGTIAAAGTGALVQAAGTFNAGNGGKTTGTQPIVLENTALHYAGTGADTIAVRGEATTLSGSPSVGRSLSIQSTCGAHARATAFASFTNSGTIALTNGDGCGNNATLSIVGLTLTNKGTVNSESPHGGLRTVEGSVKNEGTVSLSAGETLKVTGTYTETSKGTVKTAIASSSSFGALSVAGAAKVAGTLTVTEVALFAGKGGETFGIVASPSLTGTFSDLDATASTGTPGLYYMPAYSSTAVTLKATQATLTPTPAKGKAGSKVKLTGTGYRPGEKVKLVFLDAKKGKSAFPTATANGSGEISAEGTISSKAVKGTGTFSASDTLDTGLVVKASFEVE